LDTFKEAEGREREHHLKMMGEYSKVLGAGAGRPGAGGRICPHCGRTVDLKWKVCAYCGKKLE
ncbi:MAG: zinc ribbon domain-containing protein, partial [Thermoplasmata archaeon]|nr:zinc ribbon domain-containing protein [Thermoplasmata archaeon]